jgi:hypothetical protein
MATVRIQVRRGTASQWSTTNPVLAAGEMGVETDTNKFKFGNGTATWSALSYANADTAGITEISQDAINAALDMGTGLTKTYNDGANTITIAINDAVWANRAYVDSAVSALGNTADSTYIPLDDRGAVNGVASLNAQGKVPNTEIDQTVIATRSYADNLQSQNLVALEAHKNLGTNVHGIADVSDLVVTAGLTEAINDLTIAAASDATAKADAAQAAATAVATAAAATATAAATAAAAASTALTTHDADTTNVHGIANTALLATQSYADAQASAAQSAAITASGSALSSHESDTTNVHGIADVSLLALKSEVEAVTKTTLGLGNVDNTADASKPVSTAQATAIATAKSEAIADATSQVNALLTGAPAALNTLDELAAALGDDANFAASVTTSLGLKVDSLTPITQKTSSYTLSALTERDDLIEMGSSSALTLTIPADSAVNFPIGTSLDILQTSTGQVTIAGAGGVTVNATPGLKLRTQWSSATLFKRAANTWIVMGDLTA